MFQKTDGLPNVVIQYKKVQKNAIFEDIPDSYKPLLTLFPRIPNHLPVSGQGCLIIRNPDLVEKLNICSGHCALVNLELREYSAVITDFRQHKIDIFCTTEGEHSLINARIGPSAFSTFLHDFNALMIHSSCVSFNGKAAVFLAMDNGGKTTAATLCEGGRVLSDDQNLFRQQSDGGWLAYGTPWTTFPPDPGSAVPAAFFLLEKADVFSLQELKPLELFSFLWNEHSSSRFMIPKVYQTKLFDLYRSLSFSAPAYLMKFPKDYVDQEAILKCLNS